MTQDELTISVHKDYPLWEKGKSSPTYRQLEMVAKKTYAPIGHFYLPEPPGEEGLPIPDYRAPGNNKPGKPSINLLDTIYTCQSRQDWFSDYAVAEGDLPLAFVGSAKLSDDPAAVGRKIRKKLGFSPSGAGNQKVRNPSLKELVEKAEDIGVLVMASGHVGANTLRKLDPEEFRGFALADRHAPVVFINGADAKAAQTFTLAHELAHIWLGVSALSNYTPDKPKQRKEETWCGKVAAELLVPMDAFRNFLGPDSIAGNESALSKVIPSLSRQFRVSPLVSIQRLLDGDYISKREFSNLCSKEIKANKEKAAMRRARNYKSKPADSDKTARPRKGSNKPVSSMAYVDRSVVSRAGYRFTAALVNDTVDGNTDYVEAMRLLDCKQTATIKSLARELECPE